MEVEIHHRVYTHADDGQKATGGRFEPVERDAAQILPAEALQELNDLLAGLSPERDGPAFAFRRFAGGRDRFACVVASYRGFEDAAGRKGLLNHARVVQIPKDASWLDPYPLVAIAEDFSLETVRRADPLDRLRVYLSHLASGAVVVQALSQQSLRALPPSVMYAVVLRSLDALDQDARGMQASAPESRVAELARAWAALPVGLQRRSTWAYNAAEGVRVQLVWTLAGTDIFSRETPAVATCVANYLRLLLDPSYDLRSVLEDENLDLGRFKELVQQQALEAGRRLESPDMAKDPKRTEPRTRQNADRPTLDPDTVADLNRQYEAMLASLKEYVDLRLAGFDASGAGNLPARAAQLPPRRETGNAPSAEIVWLARYGWLVVVVTIALLLAVATHFDLVTWLPGQVPVTSLQPLDTGGAQPTGTQTETQTETQATEIAVESSALKIAIADAARDDKWVDGFRKYASRGPRPVLDLMAKASRLTQSDGVGAKLQDIANRLAGTAPALTDEEWIALRNILVEYIATQAAPGQGVSIDENLDDLTADVVRRVKEDAKVTTGANNASKWGLQSQIILRWLEAHPS